MVAIDTLDWAVPEALTAVVGRGHRVLMRAGGCERVLDALLLDPARVTVAAETEAERAMLDLKSRAVEVLPPDVLWQALGSGRCPPAVAAVLVASISGNEDSARFWKRRRYMLLDLYRHGRAGWLMWAFDTALMGEGVDNWERMRWRINAVLYAAFAISPA